MADFGKIRRYLLAMTWHRDDNAEYDTLVEVELRLLSPNEGEDVSDPPSGAIQPYEDVGKHRIPATHVDVGIVETEPPPDPEAAFKVAIDVILKYIDGRWHLRERD